MKKLMSIFGAALFVFSLTLSSCSEDEKAKEEVKNKSDEEKENTDMNEDVNIDDVNKIIDIYQEVLKIADDIQKHDD